MTATCHLGALDPLALAWAAGFFDGEGSTYVYECRPGYLRFVVSVPQSGGADAPETLYRFQRAMLGLGEIVRNDPNRMWCWRARSAEEGQAAVASMWSQFGTVKGLQASVAVRAFHLQYVRGSFRPRAPRRRTPVHQTHTATSTTIASRQALELAWAAGFLDAEGSFGLVRSNDRKGGPPWYRVRASATQHGDVGVPPAVLHRLRSALGGLGRIERHGEPDDFKWVVEGVDAIQSVLAATSPHLSSIKTQQALGAIARFQSQLRLKGNAEHCLRGHTYDRIAIRGGRKRRVCSACARSFRERSRARAEIADGSI